MKIKFFLIHIKSIKYKKILFWKLLYVYSMYKEFILPLPCITFVHIYFFINYWNDFFKLICRITYHELGLSSFFVNEKRTVHLERSTFILSMFSFPDGSTKVNMNLFILKPIANLCIDRYFCLFMSIINIKNC